MIYTDYYGYVSLQYWEYLVAIFYLTVLFIVFARRKNVAIKKAPEYKYFMWGMYAKLFGGLFFCLIYFYYYKGGDTIAYFYSAKALANLAVKDPVSYVKVLFGGNDMKSYQYFDSETGWPLNYVYADARSYMVIRMISPLIVLTFGSYLNTTLLVASISYFGVWRLYRMFVRYFPSLSREFAIGVLFMPSVIFWGSGVMKDTITFAALCYLLPALDNIRFAKKDVIGSSITLVISSFVLIMIKPYIFMCLFPVVLLWVFYHRITRLRNALIKFVLLPVVLVGLFFGSLYVLHSLGDRLDKFSLDQSLETIVTVQADMKRSKEYGNNYFDLGELEATWQSILSKSPMAVFAALYRPSLFDARNVVMYLSAFENLYLLLLTISVLYRSRVVYIFTLLSKNPLLLMCIIFSVLYGFVIGISTPNFGALVRFKIPLIPLLVCGLFIMSFILKQRRLQLAMGRRFRFETYVDGEPSSIGGQQGARNRKAHGR